MIEIDEKDNFGLFRLELEKFMDDAVDTLPGADVMLEIHRGAQLPGFGAVPQPAEFLSGEESPPAAQGSLTQSQLAYIDLVEDSVESASYDDEAPISGNVYVDSSDESSESDGINSDSDELPFVRSKK